MLWGTYRPGVYFGLRPRAPKSMIFGLMWLDPLRQDALTNIRHQAEMRDGLSQYGWLAHDGEGFGRQGILDEGLNITTSWVKNTRSSSSTTTNSNNKGEDSEGSSVWSARVVAHRRTVRQNQDTQEEEEAAISFFVYIATEDGSAIQLNTDNLAEIVSNFDVSGAVMNGNTNAIGKWKLHLNVPSNKLTSLSANNGDDNNNDEETDKNNKILKRPSIVETSFMGIRTPHLHNLTESVHEGLIRSLYAQNDAGREYQTLSLPNLVDPGSNVVVIQITAMVPTTLDIAFSQYNSDNTNSGSKEGSVIVGGELTSRLAAAEIAFNTRFESTFGKLNKPAGTNSAARAALSNLLGGMGYWYGHSLVKLKKQHSPQAPSSSSKNIKSRNNQEEEEILKMWDTPLYSATPSRSFFPRGFLWDEGFHQLLVQKWNPALSRDALAHWLDLMTASGWIPREQILSEEARARVPSEFIAQSPDAANPPALFLPLAEMAERVVVAQAQKKNNNNESIGENIDSSNDLEFLKAAWPRLRTWFVWYNESQAGPVAGSFRWRGRVDGDRELNPKTLTSGLDDYPRASHPSSEERHLDLRCWMALAAHSLASVGAAVGAPENEIAEFRAFAAHLDDFEELKKLHWDEKTQTFSDWGLHSENIELISEENNNGGNNGRVVKSPPSLQYVPHYGYLSLFPLIMNLIPNDSPILGQQIALLQKESELWTPFGLRSLSKSSSLYNKHNTQHDPPYWRGPIWINVNYLVLRALRRYEHQGGPYSKPAGHAANDLRTALVKNLLEQYNARGYLYEQYNDESGDGKGCHPFTGWTALLTLIAGES
jgi:mannosyl-oligosaccharide glucosidase